MRAQLAERLDRIGIVTQPEVACRLLDLANDPDAQVTQYTRVIKHDAALSGRLLRLANSAFFAQRQAVTSLDRAGVLLGLERLRAFSLGFYLARGAATDPANVVSRRVWGESAFRAFLAAELARRAFPAMAGEAFVVGLMLDAGIPLMLKLAGAPMQAILDDNPGPGKLHARESTSLPFTHTDVIAALASRWKLPELLAKPLEWHHTPADGLATQPLQRLQRVAYYVGSLDLNERTQLPDEPAPLSSIAGRVLGIDAESLSQAVKRASAEYQAATGLFTGIAESLTDPDAVAVRVHVQLVGLLEHALTSPMCSASSPRTERFRLGGLEVEFGPADPGWLHAVLLDGAGERVAAYRLAPNPASLALVRQAFGLEPAPGDEDEKALAYLARMAA